MISVEKFKGRHLVSFRGKKSQFSEYINKVMSLEEKQYDFEKYRWSFDSKGIEKIYDLFKVSFKRNEPINIITKSNKVLDYENMGSTMKLIPYEYQKEAIKFGLDHKESLIVYPCGAGKTPCGIGIYLEARGRGIINGPGVIIVKASLKTQWVKEIQKFSDLKPVIIRTSTDISSSIEDKIKRRKARISKLKKEKDKSGKLDLKKIKDNGSKIEELKHEVSILQEESDNLFNDQFKGSDLYVLNYETLKDPNVRKYLHKVKIEFIMADEIHYIKNRESLRSKALYEFGNVKLKIGATATPVGKNPEDLFGIFKFLKPNLFPKWSDFAKSYVKYGGYGKVIGFRNLNLLRDKIQPSIIVKSKEDISDQLPSLVVIQRYCELEPAQLEINTIIFEKLAELKDAENSIRMGLKSEEEIKQDPQLAKAEALILAHQTFAQQLANSEELFKMGGSELTKEFITGSKSNKVELLVDLVEEILSSEEKVVIFSKYKSMQDIIEKRFKTEFPKVKLAYIHGQLNHTRRYKEAYDKFRDDDDYKILLCTDAGAEGINLSKCKYVIEVDIADSYQIQTQRHGRVERADSIHENVFVYQLICKDTWDEVAVKIVEKKEGYDTELIR